MVLRNASDAWPVGHDGWLFVRDQKLWFLDGDREPVDLGNSPFEWFPWRDTIVGYYGNTRSFVSIDRVTGALDTLSEFEAGPRPVRPVVSADGKWIYYMRRDTAGTDIMLVENFVP